MKTHRLINPNALNVTAIQSRQHTSLELIEDYAAQMDAGVQFDPCCAIETPEGHIYIWDGKHRLEAAIKNGAMLLVELEPGMKNEAYWRACSANKKHGLQRSKADVQKAVQDALALRQDKSDREIGIWVGCDHKTVGKYRKCMEVSGEIPQIHTRTRTVVRGEQEYQMEMPIKTEPVETPDLNQPVRHLTGFVPAEVQISTQKSLALTPQPNQEDSVANTPRQEAAEEEDAFEARLERCRACVGKHYLVKIEGVLGVTHITEVNEYLAIVRGVTYPYDANNPFPNFACGTFNFKLEDLLTGVKGYGCQYCERLSTIAGAKELTEQPVIDHPLLMCSFCLGDFQQEHLYSRDTIAICQKCATDALVALQKHV